MSRLDSNGLLTDYSVGAMERMAFDHAMPRGPARRALTVDAALKAIAARRTAADRAQTPMARALKGYNRLK